MKKTLFILMLIVPLAGFSQDGNTNLWVRVTAAKKIGKKFSVNTNVQWRFTEDMSTLGAYIGELGTGYKLNKNWEVELNYRYVGRRKYNKDDASYYYRSYHRFYGDVIYDRKISLLKLEYRMRYQNQYKDDNGAVENDKSYIRNKLELGYPNKSRFTPYVSADVFYKIGNSFEEIRYKAGTDIKINKKNSFNIGAFTTQEITETSTKDLTIVVAYKFKF